MVRLVFIGLIAAVVVGCSSEGAGESTPSDDPIAAPDPTPVPTPNPSPSGTPNILLIIADDMGFDAFSQYQVGTQTPNTPTLDGLAAQGLVFDNLWVNPLCSPTRATLLTGRYAFRTGVSTAGGDIGLNEVSIQSFLRDNAPTPYGNAVIGKWSLASNDNGNADNPNMMGIDHFAGLPSGGVGDYFSWPLSINGSADTITTNYATSEFVDLSLGWINQQTNPWFLWLAFNAPHAPIHLPPNNLHTQQLSGDQSDIDANPLEYYFAMIEAMDTEIGRLLDGLSPEDRDDLIVFFIGDNGTAFEVVQDPPGTGRAKGTLYQGGIRTPMIAYGNGVRAGQREDALINGTDFFATIAELAGLQVPGINDSVSFVALLADAEAASRDVAYSESRTQWTVRDDQYKLIQWDSGTQQLYDLINDPFEDQQLIGSGADVAAIVQSLEDLAVLIRQ